MSYSLDVNVLLYASDLSSDRHDAAREFLHLCEASPEVLCVILADGDGLSAHRHTPEHFRGTPDARGSSGQRQALLVLPHTRVVSEQDGFMDAYLHVTANIIVRVTMGAIRAHQPTGNIGC